MRNLKNSLVFLFTLVNVTISFAQPFDYNEEQYLLKRLHYRNSDGEKGVTTFVYDVNNKLYKAVWELLDSSRYSLNYYTLEKGNIVGLTRTFSDNLTLKKIYKYNNQQQIIEEHFWRSDSVKGMATYEYKDGKLAKLIGIKKDGWFTGELNFIYKNKQREKATIFMKRKQVGVVVYKYSKDGNLLEEKWDFGKRWSQTFTYEYVEKNCEQWGSSNPLLKFPCNYQLTKENYNFNKQTGGPSDFIYDKNGKLVEKIFTRSDGVKTKTTFEYNKEKKLLKSFRHYSDSTDGTFSYNYDSHGQLIEKVFDKTSGFKSNESFAYDIYGNLRFARYDSMDSWLTGNILFELDRYDRIKEGYFNADDGYTAKIVFSYDSNDLITCIHWDFSFGKTQTYTFSYKKVH